MGWNASDLLIVLLLLSILSGCSVVRTPLDPPSTGYFATDRPMPRVGNSFTADPDNLAAVMDRLSIFWTIPLADILRGIDFSLGVAVLDRNDPAEAFCMPADFDPASTRIVYCKATQDGPSPTSRRQIVLVPYDAFQAELGKLRGSARLLAPRMTMAMQYVRHLHTQFAGLQQSPVASPANLVLHYHCMVGISLRTLQARRPEQPYLHRALGFMDRFLPDASGGVDIYHRAAAVTYGYDNGSLRQCLEIDWLG